MPNEIELPDCAITDEDRNRWMHYTDGAIRGIKIIHQLTSSQLRQVLGGERDLETLRRHIGADTNPNWVIARVAETLYERGQINEQELDWITK